jgi:hypothetical protein
MRNKSSSTSLLTTAASALALLLAVPANAQDQPPAPSETQAVQVPEPAPPAEEMMDDEMGEEIVVTGQRLRGSVIGDIPPENQLNPADIRATGATDVTELLEALEPQIGSARGRGGERPVLLLNGQRISSFRELRDIPTEAIARVEVLPEEVALKYGYRADQRVVNFVLRSRFRSTAARVEGTTATEGGYVSGLGDATRLLIGEDSRTTVNLRAEGNTALTEAERDIELDPDSDEPDAREARTLIGSRRLLRGTATYNRQVGTVSVTGNAELEHSDGRSLLGLSEFALDPLVRNVTSDSAHAGVALNGNMGRWRWSGTGNADISRSLTRSDRSDEDIRDRARTTASSADIDLLANGPLFMLPAGDASATVRAGASTLHLDSSRREDDLGRTRGFASANLDLPVSRRSGDFNALGNLTLNANAQVEELSDFGTLATVGAGVNWSPVERLNLIASWTREEGAPTVQQLGDPFLETPETRIFDFTTGETVLVTAITGGNPELLSDRRNVLKIGGNWKPLEETDLRLRAEYVRSRLKDPVASFPGPSETLEAAFRDRFVRDDVDGDGDEELVSVDLRPVNFDEARRDTIRWGIDFSKPLQSRRPSREQIERLRRMRGTGGTSARPGQGARPSGGEPTLVLQEGARPPEGAQPPGSVERGGGRGGRGGFLFGPGGRQGGRIQLSFTHTLTLLDEVTIRPGVPEIDYLHGDALSQFGGRPRHELEAQAGWSNNGLGARLSANWRSGTRVDSATGEDLRFSPLATFDLRLFANLGQQFGLVSRHPWLRGSSVRLEVSNLFDSKPRVRDASGDPVFSHQPDLLDPLGRTVSVTLRKLFLPPPRFFRRAAGQQAR